MPNRYVLLGKAEAVVIHGFFCTLVIRGNADIVKEYGIFVGYTFLCAMELLN